MIRALALTLALGLQAQAAQALPPEVSIRPTARPGAAIVTETVNLKVHFNADFRPTARPGSAVAFANAAPREIFFVPVVRANEGYRPVARPGWVAPKPARVITAPGIMMAAGPAVPRPTARPYERAQARVVPAAAVVTQPQIAASGRTGKICGKRSIRGQKLSPIAGRLQGCGIANPVKVTEVAGIPLSRGAIMDCDTAKALDTWVEKGAKPTIGRLGGGLSQVNVIAGYSCRTRNSQPGAKVSEHGKGRAVDISGFTFANGKTITVQDGWKKRADRKLLEKLHKSACGTFGTVLGPKSDQYHQDHFHFDTARHRGGAYCK